MLAWQKNDKYNMSDDFFKNIDAGLDDFAESKIDEIMNDINKLPAPIEEDKLPTTAKEDPQVQRDRNFALENIKNAIKMTDQSARDVYMLAKSSDAPRAWEVLATIIKTNIDASKTLLDETNTKPQHIEAQNVTNNVTNNVVVMDTAETVMRAISGDLQIEDAEYEDE